MEGCSDGKKNSNSVVKASEEEEIYLVNKLILQHSPCS